MVLVLAVVLTIQRELALKMAMGLKVVLMREGIQVLTMAMEVAQILWLSPRAVPTMVLLIVP